MTVMRGLARLFTRTVEAAREPELRDEEMKQRRPALRCLGCNSWNRAGLVFMSNGGDYCTSCAKAEAAGPTPLSPTFIMCSQRKQGVGIWA